MISRAFKRDTAGSKPINLSTPRRGLTWYGQLDGFGPCITRYLDEQETACLRTEFLSYLYWPGISSLATRLLQTSRLVGNDSAEIFIGRSKIKKAFKFSPLCVPN